MGDDVTRCCVLSAFGHVHVFAGESAVCWCGQTFDAMTSKRLSVCASQRQNVYDKLASCCDVQARYPLRPAGGYCGSHKRLR